MLVLGVTGDVGAGKSTITDIFRKSGASVISADAVTHEKWHDPLILKKAVQRWGEEVILPDGSINANRVASIVFSDRNEYKWLCQMLHPLVREEMGNRISRLSRWIVAEIPLLFENGVPHWIDETMYISASVENRIKRNSHRGWDEAELESRESFLLPSVEKKRKADIVLNNDMPLEKLRDRLGPVIQRCRDAAGLCKVEVRFFSKDIAVQCGRRLLERRLACEADVFVTNNLRTERTDVRSDYLTTLTLYTCESRYGTIKEFIEDSYPDYSGFFLTEIKRPGTFLRYFPLDVGKA
jgi:dephospho-CoA kinase